MRISKSQQTSKEFNDNGLDDVSLEGVNFKKTSSDEPSVSIGTQARLLSLNRFFVLLKNLGYFCFKVLNTLSIPIKCSITDYIFGPNHATWT